MKTKVKRNAIEKEIIEGMARAFYVDAWAQREEEAGRTKGWAGQNLYDLAPKTSRAAMQTAAKAAAHVEAINGIGLDALYTRAVMMPGSHDRNADPFAFGSDLGMQMLGDGVSWFDDHPKFELYLPDVGFDLYGYSSVGGKHRAD